MKGVTKRTLALAALAGGLVLAPLSAHATAPGPVGPIVYVQGGNIHVVSSTGSAIGGAGPAGSSPTWSPASQEIAFVDGAGAIETMTWNGSSFGTPAVVSGTSGVVNSVAWSPNGAKLAYSDGTNIWTITPAGADNKRLTFGGGPDTQPAWSPDGGDIAFTSGRDGNSDIYVMNATDGANQTRLTTSPKNDTSPTWSPDGLTIAFTSDRDVAGGQIYQVPAGGGPEVRLSNEGTADSDPSYSSNGSQIVLVHGGANLATMSSSGGTVTEFSPVVAGTQPEWGLSFGALGPPSISPSSGLSLGTELTASNGSWSATPTSFTYQWQRCNSSGGSCVDLSGATAQTYTLTSADDGSTFRVTVTATSGSGTASSTSAATALFQSTLSAVGEAPSFVVRPAVVVTPPTGISPPADTVYIGSTMSVSLGTWRGQFPITFSYQWKKCDKNLNCYTIPLATSSFFTPTMDLFGWRVAVEVTGKNVIGSGVGLSASTVPLTALAPRGTVTPAISGSNVVGQALSVATGTWTGSQPIVFSYQWRRCDPAGTLPSCAPISGATSSTYILTDADQGWTLRAYVTGTNPAGSDTLITNHTLPALPRPRFAPKATTPPAIVGVATPSSVLVATIGTWSGDASITYTLQWQRCDATGGGCVAIAKATRRTYAVVASDAGYTLRVMVTAKNATGTVNALSSATDTIQLRRHVRGRRVVGTAKANYLAGGGGDDVLLGRAGNDTLVGGAGNDLLDAGAGNDVLVGGSGDDRILGGTGSDTILAADGQRDVIDCGAGNDRAVVDSIDVVKSCESIQVIAPPTTSTTTTGTTTTVPTTTAKP